MLKTQFGFDSTSNDSWIAVVARPHWLLNWPIGVISVLHQQQQCVWQIKQAYYPLCWTCSTILWLCRWQSQIYNSQRLKITNSLCSRSTPERVSTGDFSRMTNNCTIPDWWHNTADPPTLVNYVWTTNTIYSSYQWQRKYIYTVFHKIGTPLYFCNNFFKCWSIWMKITSLYSLGNLLSGDVVCNCIFYKYSFYSVI